MDLSDFKLESTVTMIIGALLFLARLLFRDKVAKYEGLFTKGVEVAYWVVNEIAIRTETKIDDKAALALATLKTFMGSQGAPLKEVDEARARLLFQAMHGVEKAK